MSVAYLAELVGRLATIVSELDAKALSPPDAVEAVSLFVKGENLCATGKALCAERATCAGEHRRSGHPDTATWLAARAGDSRQRARDALETAAALPRLGRLEGALRSGELSPTKARLVAEAASLDPSGEPGLLELARHGSLSELREGAEALKAAVRSAEDDARRYEQIRRSRHLRTFTGRDGAFVGRLSLTPDDGARVLAVLQPASDLFFEEARREGRREPNEAYLADALVAVVTGEWPGGGDEAPEAGGDGTGAEGTVAEGTGTEAAAAGTAAGPAAGGAAAAAEQAGDANGATGNLPSPEGACSPAPLGGTDPPGIGPGRRRGGRSQPPRATVICRVDLAALRRGALGPGETCELPGVGPVPLAVARQLMGDCFLKLVLTEGVDVRSVVHYGRTIPAHLKTALQFRDRTCVVPGCGRTFGLEYDHIVEFARGGPTTLDNLARLCGPHHALKTHKGYRLRGGPGRWEWLAPRAGPTDEPAAGETGLSAPCGRAARRDTAAHAAARAATAGSASAPCTTAPQPAPVDPTQERRLDPAAANRPNRPRAGATAGSQALFPLSPAPLR